MSDNIDIQQSIVEIAYTPLLEASKLQIQQSLTEFAYQPILPPAYIANQNSIVELAYLPNKIYSSPSLPTSDINNNSWSGSPLYSTINSDYILSSLTPSSDSFEVGFSKVTNYNSNNDLLIQVGISKVTSGTLQPTGNGDAIDVQIDFLINNTIEESFTYRDVQDGGLEYFYISGVVKDSVQNDDFLSIQITADTTGIDVSNPRYIKIDYLALGIDADFYDDPPVPLVSIRNNVVIRGGNSIIKALS